MRLNRFFINYNYYLFYKKFRTVVKTDFISAFYCVHIKRCEFAIDITIIIIYFPFFFTLNNYYLHAWKFLLVLINNIISCIVDRRVFLRLEVFGIYSHLKMGCVIYLIWLRNI